MPSERAETLSRCPGCAAQVRVHHCVGLYSGAIHWSESIRCTHCGYAQEADSDEGDAVARAAILAANGTWAVAVTDLGPAPIWVLRVIRNELGMNPGEARRRLDRLAVGTRLEMEFLLAKFVAERAVGECRRVDGEDGLTQ